MKQKYFVLVALFFMVTILNAQTSLTFTTDTAVDNGQNITETITTGGVTYVLTATATVDAILLDLGGGDNIFFANIDSLLNPWVITVTADGIPISFNLTEIDYDTIGAGSITITNENDDIITPTTLYNVGSGSITPSNTTNATNITSFNIVPGDNDDFNDFGFHNIDITIPLPCTEPDVPTVTANAICVGSMATLNINGNLNDATEWHIYSDMAATVEVGTTSTTTFNITPTTTTTYYLRGEGGCTTPATLGNTIVTVNTLDDASFSYDATTYTTNDSDPTPTITGLTGGSFSSSPAGLSITMNSGAIDLSNSTIGTYTITYETAGTCPSSADTSISIISSEITWTGATDNDWDTASNWNTNTLPVSTSNIVIPSGLTNYPTASTAVTFNTMVINSGATFIPTSTATGTVSYLRNLPTTNWYLVGAPVDDETQQDLIANNTFATGTGSNIGLASYDNETDTGNPEDVWSYSNLASTGFVIAGIGASIKLAAPGDVSITGSILNSNRAIPVNQGNRTSFNLLANPYTAHFNSATFAANNNVIKENTFWFWSGNEGKYITINDVNPIQISPSQAFFIEAMNDGIVEFRKGDLNHNGTDTFVSKQKTHDNFKLEITNGQKSSSTEVFYVAGKTTGKDYGYDAKMFGGTTYNFAVFTELITDNEGEHLAIQTLPTDNSTAIPVGIIANAGEEVTFSIESASLPEGVDLYLEDTKNNEFVNLSKGNYTTTLTENINGVGQFYITTSAKILSTADENLDLVSVYKSANNELTINGLKSKTNISIFSILGKEVLKTTLEASGVNKINLPSLSAGVYLVMLNSDAGKTSKKITLE